MNLLLVNAVFIGALGLMFGVLGQNIQSRLLGIAMLVLSGFNLYGLMS